MRSVGTGRQLRRSLLAALFGGLLALGIASAVALATPARGKSQATRGRAHRGECARLKSRHARRARRCRAKAHRKKTTAAPKLATPTPTSTSTSPPSAGATPSLQSPAPALAAAPAPIAIAALPEPREAAPEDGEPEPPSIPHVQVSAVEYSFSLSRTSVPAGEVVLEFVNDGQDAHNLHLENGEGPLTESIGSTPSKGIDDLHLQMQPGSYTLFCSLPTHEARGMKATLTVE
jgi:plastocyanin